ncbi:MAG: hypothetical protein IJT02_04630 [Synergistaceae bacterium]|nr:hypothetical protein [Synergistaceae bacterium]
MTRFRKTAGVLAALAVVSCLASAGYSDYKFDDLYGPSGVSYQWMVLTDAGETIGDTHTNPIDVSGDMLTSDTPVLNVLSGKSETAITDRSLNTMFLVVADDKGEFDMNFRVPSLDDQFDVATPNLAVSTLVREDAVPYTDTKTALGWPGGDYDQLWRKYHFEIARYTPSRKTYDTVAQYFYFQQNPNSTPSQGMPVPMVISNVVYGTASDVPLELRLTLRDSTNMNGNIAAYDLIDDWRVDDNYPYGGDAHLNDGQWVFVPVNDLNTDNTRIEYLLTTEVVNHTAVRYAAYDGGTLNTWVFPSFWKFDIPRYQGTTYIARQFQLAPASHIAPGLVSVYRRQYNVNESNKRPLRLFPVDDARGTGVYDLRLNHRVIFGKRLGSTYGYPAAEGRFNLFEVTAFQLKPASMNFYDNVARITGSTKTVTTPTTANLTASTVKHDAMPSEALQYFTIDHTIPANLRTSSVEGMLPLHITFNIPITQIQSRTNWNDMLDEWRTTGQLSMFSDYFHLYVMVDNNDGTPNPWDMTQELTRRDAMDLVKVFIDEDRGRITTDNDRGLITVSFIAMLMNGTRDGEKPEFSIVPDTSSSGVENKYIVLRDGHDDTKWNMTFFIAPAEYINNPDVTSPDASAPASGDNSGTAEGGGGGGCSSVSAGIFAFAAAVLWYMKRERRNS